MRTSVKLALALVLIVLAYKLLSGGDTAAVDEIDRID